MRLSIRNHIEVEGQTEIFDQHYEADYKEKDGSSYLIYENEEKERVVLKFDQKELVMTRFSNPRSQMTFSLAGPRSSFIATPMGIQEIESRTQQYQLGEQNLTLSYQLWPIEGAEPFASYSMVISWQQ